MYQFCYSMNDYYKPQHSHGHTPRRKDTKVYPTLPTIKTSPIEVKDKPYVCSVKVKHKACL